MIDNIDIEKPFEVGDYVRPDLRGAFADKSGFEITELKKVGDCIFALGSPNGSYPIKNIKYTTRPMPVVIKFKKAK